MSIKNVPSAVITVLFILLATYTVSAQNIHGELDKIVSSHYEDDEPGASILIAKNGRPIYTKSVGQANLELNVPLKPENVFEIGSITKQFTAMAILMLEEQGKLNIGDDITNYIPDYPTNGKKITIHNLLNHTSGIKSYTSMPTFIADARKDMTPSELIDVFKNEPMDFEPGEKFLYNNSGYILLGHIIERVSGQSYEDFIEKNIFSQIGMTNSYYGSMREIIENRASGYQMDGDSGRFMNADYLSLTLPYAAGSIMSSVEDLLKWQNAVSANKFVKRETLNKAINGSKLNDGKEIPYGYGWGKGNINGSPAITHSGGIFGYTSNGIYLPEEDIYVVGLSNCQCKNIAQITIMLAAEAIGKPFPSLDDKVELSETQLKKWVGAYEFEGDGATRFIQYENGQLTSLREGSEQFNIYPLSETRFVFDDVTIEYQFKTENGMKSVDMKVNGESQTGKQIEKAVPSERSIIALSVDELKSYEGKFQIGPKMIFTVFVEDNRIFAQLTGQPKAEIFPESKSKFFLKVVPAEIVFHKKDTGEWESLTLYQGGQEIEATRID